MKIFKTIGIILVVLVVLAAIGNSTNKNKKQPNNQTQQTTTTTTSPTESVTTILPLGASRVEGNRPQFESYRYELWKMLDENGYEFDFIGTRSDPKTYPAAYNDQFDRDHEGRGGWTSGQILNNLNGWLRKTGQPDIVLFSTPGGNDAIQNLSYDQAISNINVIIDRLRSNNPNVVIIMEQAAPGHSQIVSAQMQNYFDRLRADVTQIASAKSTTTSPIILVDMHTGFSNNFFADPVHYNEAGAKFIAQRYYNVLINLLDK